MLKTKKNINKEILLLFNTFMVTIFNLTMYLHPYRRKFNATVTEEGKWG